VGINLYVGLGVAGLLVLLALLVLFWPKGQGASPKVAAAQVLGIPENLGRVDALGHARRKIDADDALKKEARAEVEAELMRRRAQADAVELAKRDALLSAQLSGGLVSPVPPAPPAPPSAGN
jgi:hypothetical protein